MKDWIDLLWVEKHYLLVPSLPPLLSRHGWSRAHCVWVKVIMKLLAWMLERKTKNVHTWMQTSTHEKEHANIYDTCNEAMSAQYCFCTHLARDLIADWHDAAVSQLQHAHHLAGHHVQRHLGNRGNPSCWGVRKAVAHYGDKNERRKVREIGGDTRGEGCDHSNRQITEDQLLPWERKGSEEETSKQSTTVSPCAEQKNTKSDTATQSMTVLVINQRGFKVHLLSHQDYYRHRSGTVMKASL